MKGVILIGLAIILRLADAGGYGGTGSIQTSSATNADAAANSAGSVGGSFHAGIETEGASNIAANIKDKIVTGASNIKHNAEGHIKNVGEAILDFGHEIKTNIHEGAAAIGGAGIHKEGSISFSGGLAAQKNVEASGSESLHTGGGANGFIASNKPSESGNSILGGNLEGKSHYSGTEGLLVGNANAQTDLNKQDSTTHNVNTNLGNSGLGSDIDSHKGHNFEANASGHIQNTGGQNQSGDILASHGRNPLRNGLFGKGANINSHPNQNPNSGVNWQGGIGTGIHLQKPSTDAASGSTGDNKIGLDGNANTNLESGQKFNGNPNMYPYPTPNLYPYQPYHPYPYPYPGYPYPQVDPGFNPMHWQHNYHLYHGSNLNANANGNLGPGKIEHSGPGITNDPRKPNTYGGSFVTSDAGPYGGGISQSSGYGATAGGIFPGNSKQFNNGVPQPTNNGPTGFHGDANHNGLLGGLFGGSGHFSGSLDHGTTSNSGLGDGIASSSSLGTSSTGGTGAAPNSDFAGGIASSHSYGISKNLGYNGGIGGAASTGAAPNSDFAGGVASSHGYGISKNLGYNAGISGATSGGATSTGAAPNSDLAGGVASSHGFGISSNLGYNAGIGGATSGGARGYGGHRTGY